MILSGVQIYTKRNTSDNTLKKNLKQIKKNFHYQMGQVYA